MSSGTFYKNASTRHAVFVQRFAGGQVNELDKYIQRVRKQTKARLAQDNLTDISRTRLRALLADIEGIAKANYDKMGVDLSKNMLEFGEYEGDFSSRMLTKGAEATFAPPALTAIEAALSTAVIEVQPGSNLTIKKALSSFTAAKSKQIVRTVKDGVTLGQTTEEITGNVDAVVRTTQKRQLRSLVTTITNQVSSLSRQLTIEENSDIVDKVLWVSTLDGNTTATCRSLDGKSFPIKSGPRPPLHWSCRSTVVPQVKKEFNLSVPSERPSVGSTGAEEVKGQSTYNSWLKTQPKSFQEEVLGETRTKLFRDGNLSMDKFVDKNYQELSLKQLRRKEPLAFEKAGLE